MPVTASVSLTNPARHTWVKLSDHDARRAHEMKRNAATFERLRRHFRFELRGSTGDIV